MRLRHAIPWLLMLPFMLTLTSCAVVKKTRNLVRKSNMEARPMDPERKGWALMMSDEEFARYKQGNPTTAATATPGQPTDGPVPGQLPDGVATENPTQEGGLFDFSNAVQGRSAAAARLAWQRSATVAAKQSRVTGTPLLICFTHRSSKTSQDMENTLLLQPEFRALAQESFVPLLMDFADQETSRSPMYRELKSQLSVRGFPVIIVTLPDRTEVLRLTGYKVDYVKSYVQKLKDAVTQAQKLMAARREKLEKKENYRTWKNKDGKPVFAKLIALDANMGTFQGEWGETFKTFLTRLSPEDQAWIEQRRQ